MSRINKNYLVLSGIIILSLIVVGFLPGRDLFSKPTICIHYRLFGIQCPFCGSVRAINCLLHLDFTGTWNYNYNVFLLALFLPILFARIFSRELWIKRMERIMLVLLAIGYILIYVMRLFSIP